MRPALLKLIPSRTHLVKTTVFIFLLSVVMASSHAAPKIASDNLVQAYTVQWQGPRLADGRPKVSDDLLARMKNVSIEEAWSVLRNEGYHNQFEGNWKMIHSEACC